MSSARSMRPRDTAWTWTTRDSSISARTRSGKYDPATGQVVAEIARTPEREGGARVGLPPPTVRELGQGGRGPVINFITPRPAPEPAVVAQRQAAAAAFREQYPPETPMVVGGIEEIRIVDEDNEMYVADNYLGGRILVFDLDTLAVQARLGSLWQASRRDQR